MTHPSLLMLFSSTKNRYVGCLVAGYFSWDRLREYSLEYICGYCIVHVIPQYYNVESKNVYYMTGYYSLLLPRPHLSNMYTVILCTVQWLLVHTLCSLTLVLVALCC